MASNKRKECPDSVARNQELALSSTIYILRNIGPLGFCLKEEGENKEYKVFIGSRHTCTCNAFLKDKDLCRHICWVILKRFKISKDDSISFQFGMNDREIEALLTETKKVEIQPVKKQSNSDNSEPENTLRKPLSPEDVCPICQENFFEKHWPITYCRNGCGNNVHIRCMKIWADHQIKDFGSIACETVKCPYCRGEFCTLTQLKKEYRNDPTRLMKFKREVTGSVDKKCETDFSECETSEHQRDENAADEKMRQKKRQLALKTIEMVPSHVIPKESRLLIDGVQCCLCLKPFQAHEFIGRLPCRHRFHKNCLINWFTENQPVCPIDKKTIEIKLPEVTKAVNNKKQIESKDEFSFLLCGRNLGKETAQLESKTTKRNISTRQYRNRNLKKESKTDFKKCSNLSTEFALIGNKLGKN